MARTAQRSHHIRSRSASRFFKGAKHAGEHGRPLNLHVTLNLSHTSATSAQASAAAIAMCGKFTRWLNHQSKKALAGGNKPFGRPTYEAVVEVPNGLHHVHWLVHVPEALQSLFAAKLPTWLSKVCGEVARPSGAIHVSPIDTVMALGRYCMKGLDPYHARRYWVRPVDQGVVLGKRVIISRSLGPKARQQEENAHERPPRAAGSRADRAPWDASRP